MTQACGRLGVYFECQSPCKVHRRLGYCILLACAIMDGAGYYMGRYSAFPHFETFSVWFALPFAVWLILIPLTAKLKLLHTHRLLSNMLVKGCIATPLSRVGGAHLQRMGWETASGYYVGIFGVAMVIGVWQLIDIYYYLVAPVLLRLTDAADSTDGQPAVKRR